MITHSHSALLKYSFSEVCVARLEIFFWAAGTILWKEALQLQVDFIQLYSQVQACYCNLVPF